MFDTSAYEKKMKNSVDVFEDALSSIRASQANAGVIARVNFEYYGTPTRIVDMASVTVTDARTLVISPYDKTTLKAMEKALLASDVGITPNNDGSVIRLSFPQLTEERRHELSKKVAKFGEEAKVSVRNVRRDANEDIKKQKKDSVLTEDDAKDAEKKVQELTDRYIKNVDAVIEKKTKEIMAI
ncbi:MAG: ribosome recycling factor [Clostridia bacterium]|nr:ribosome recycling factor [Clostridia bacterium]